MSSVKDTYREYWQGKKGLEDFEVYERNQALKRVTISGGKVLDLACGEGAVGLYLQSLGCVVTGLDLAGEALKKARQRGLKVVTGDVEKRLPFPDESFDLVFWGDNVEHLFNPTKTVHEIHRILKQGGKLILSCPNMSYWRYRLYFLRFGMVPSSEWFHTLPWEWEHIRFFNRGVMKQFLQNGGFTEDKFIGVSRRRVDHFLKNIWPEIFGMIMLVEARKQ